MDKVRRAFLQYTKTEPPLGVTAAEIKFVRSLQQKKFRKQSGLFVVEGVKPVSELLASEVAYDQIYTTEELSFLPVDALMVSKKELERMSALKSSNKVIAVAKIPEPEMALNGSLVLLLDGIKDPGNLGTIIRTAKWFGVSEIICINDCVDAYDRKVVQSTMGALFRVSISYLEEDEALKTLVKNNYRLVGTSMKGDSVYNTKLDGKTVLVVGSESHGMSESLTVACNQLLSVPNMENEQTIESLNAAIATGIIISEIKRQRLS